MSENVSQLANRAGCDPSFKLLMRVWKAELDECWSLLRKYVTEVCACSYSQGQITHKTWPEIADGCSSDLLVFDWLTGARLAGWLAGWLMLVWLADARLADRCFLRLVLARLADRGWCLFLRRRASHPQCLTWPQ